MMVRPLPGTMPPPEPQPALLAAMPIVRDARDAIALALNAWSRIEFEDALDSAEKFIREARKALPSRKRKVEYK